MDLLRDTLPKEIIDVMISFMTDGGKRVLRTTNRYWFDYIKIDEFKLFFVRPTMVQQITQHFLRFYGNKPIGLSFEKIVPSGKTEEYPVHHLAQLTNLTSLRFDFYSTFWNARFWGANQRLNSLTNLLCLSNITPISHLTNLTTLKMDEEIASERSYDLSWLPLYKNLRSLVFRMEDSQVNPFSLIGTPSKLTHLHIKSEALAWPEISDNIMSQFGNLKSLEIDHIHKIEFNSFTRLPRGCLEHLTGMEKLDLYYNQPPDDSIFTLTQLTKLYIHEPGNKFNYHRLAGLANVKVLGINAPRDEDYSFLRLMTSLEKFNMWSPDQLVDALQYLSAQHLTHLSINDMPQSFNLDHLSNLTTIRAFAVHEEDVPNPKNYDALCHLMHVTTLYFTTRHPNSVHLTVLSNLTNLKQLTLQSYDSDMTKTSNHVTFKNLKNLEKLHLLLYPSQTLFNDLCYLTRLTRLEMRLQSDIYVNNQSALDNLTSLKVLIVHNQLPYQHLCHWFTRLTDLEHLYFAHADSEEVIASLSVLTNLTRLHLFDAGSVLGVHLTKLTSLQVLYLGSKLAEAYYKDHSGAIHEKLTRLISSNVY